MPFPSPTPRLLDIRSLAQLARPSSIVLPPSLSPSSTFPACFVLCQTSPLWLSLSVAQGCRGRSLFARYTSFPHHPTPHGHETQKDVGLFVCISLPLNVSLLGEGSCWGRICVNGTDCGHGFTFYGCVLISKLITLYTLDTYTFLCVWHTSMKCFS